MSKATGQRRISSQFDTEHYSISTEDGVTVATPIKNGIPLMEGPTHVHDTESSS